MPSTEPYSLDAEQSVLGAVLSDNSTFWRLGQLEVDDFAVPVHREIFSQCSSYIRQGMVADAFSIYERFAERQVELDGADLGYLGELQRYVGSTANADKYAMAVRSLSNRRRASVLLHDALEALPLNPDAITDTIRGLQRIVARSGESKSFQRVLEATMSAREVRAKARNDGFAVGVSTTLPGLDILLGGLYGPRLYVLGGRPGKYKSALAWQIALRAGIRGTPVGLCSLEMDDVELGERAYANTKPEADWPIWVDDRSSSLAEIAGRIVEWRNVHGIELAVLDYLQLVRSQGRNRFDELAEVSRTLKQLAMELKMPILALSQVSREVEKEKRRPRLSDLRECGNIEQDADVVLFIHGTHGVGPAADTYEMLIAKNRGGPARAAPISLYVDGARAFVGERV